MTRDQYQEALSIPDWHIYAPYTWGAEIRRDYLTNPDIPDLRQCTIKDYIAVVEYYYYFFPVIKAENF